MSTISLARKTGDDITAGIPVIDHHSHAAYVRPGEVARGIIDAEREIAAASVESSLPHADYCSYIEAEGEGDRARLNELEARYRISEIVQRAIDFQEHTVFLRALYDGARALHGDHPVPELREISGRRSAEEAVGLYDTALELSQTDFVLTDVPMIDATQWSASRYRQIARIDPYLFPFSHPPFTRRGADTPRFRRVFADTLQRLLDSAGAELSTLDFDGYREFVRGSIRSRRDSGVVGLKIASAYVRTLAFADVSAVQARAAYERMRANPASPDPVDHRLLADHLVFDIAELAQELELPVQIHVGRGHSEPGLLLSEAHPILLEPLLTNPRLNRLRVVLIHGGFPHSSYLTALAQTYGNVHVDFSWMPIMHERVLQRTLEEWIEHLPAHKVMFGTDTGTAEFHVAATARARTALARVLGAGVTEGQWSARQADRLAVRLLRDNVMELYQQGASR